MESSHDEPGHEHRQLVFVVNVLAGEDERIFMPKPTRKQTLYTSLHPHTHKQLSCSCVVPFLSTQMKAQSAEGAVTQNAH